MGGLKSKTSRSDPGHKDFQESTNVYDDQVRVFCVTVDDYVLMIYNYKPLQRK